MIKSALLASCLFSSIGLSQAYTGPMPINIPIVVPLEIGDDGGDCIDLQACNPEDPIDNFYASVSESGVITYNVPNPEAYRSVTVHHTLNGVTTVSCSGGCQIQKGWFGVSVCDSQGVCVEVKGKVYPIAHAPKE